MCASAMYVAFDDCQTSVGTSVTAETVTLSPTLADKAHELICEIVGAWNVGSNITQEVRGAVRQWLVDVADFEQANIARPSNLDLNWALARVKEYRAAGPKGGRMPYQRAMLAMADEIDRLEALKSAFAHDAAMYGAKLADVETSGELEQLRQLAQIVRENRNLAYDGTAARALVFSIDNRLTEKANECRHGVSMDFNCNGCSDSGEDPRAQLKTDEQRAALDARLAGRPRKPVDLDEVGTPHLDETPPAPRNEP